MFLNFLDVLESAIVTVTEITARVSIDYFKDFTPSETEMAKQSSLQFFSFDLLVTRAYYVVKILNK